jgi:hypothetical protein
MLYREIIAVCSDINTEHINTVCGQNVEFVNVTPGGTYSDHWGLRRVNCVFNFSVQIFLQTFFVFDRHLARCASTVRGYVLNVREFYPSLPKLSVQIVLNFP